MRTLVVSDLHLGTVDGRDALRRDAPLRALVEAIDRADRVVLLGDVVELRHAPARESLAAAEPVLRALGEPGRDIVVVPGNHDHALVSAWLEARGRTSAPAPLALDGRADARAWLPRRVVEALAPARVEVRYPGVWLREDVYATHGHYLDRLTTIPTFERIACGAMVRIVGSLPADRADPEDFEAALAPLYAWMHAVAQGRGGQWAARGHGASASAWQTLTGAGPRPLRARALAAAFPVAIRGLNRAGIGPVRPTRTGEELRRAGLRAMGETVRLLGVQAAHVLFGHTHRAGPLPGDDRSEWRAPTGALLHNTGCWIDEPVFAAGGVDSPYFGGRAVWVDSEPGSAPELVRLTERLR